MNHAFPPPRANVRALSIWDMLTAAGSERLYSVKVLSEESITAILFPKCSLNHTREPLVSTK